MISRRRFLTASLLWGSAVPVLSAWARPGQTKFERKLSALEREHGGRLGVAVLDMATGVSVAHRGDERFAMCSTFKLLAVAFVLARVDRGQESLNRRIVYTTAGLVPHSPVTEQHAGGDGLAVSELCEAAMLHSDNTAANLLLDSFGGPPGLTAYVRSLGDDITRLDRIEPFLNQSTPGDPRDTTTPSAMLRTFQKIIAGNALFPRSHEQLTAWLVANQTGASRLRASVPPDWRAGDKTGTGENRETNDIAVFWPPGKPPILVTAYYAGANGSDEERNAVLAEVGRLVFDL